MGTVQERRDQGGVAFQRRGDLDPDARVSPLSRGNQLRKIAFEMKAERQEVGKDHDQVHAIADEHGDSAGEVRLAEFEECRLDVGERTQFGQIAGYGSDTFIGRFDPRSVREDHEARCHNEANPISGQWTNPHIRP